MTKQVYTVRSYVPSSILVIEVQYFSPFNICASRTRQAGDSRKMLGFCRQIVDSFEAPCGNIDGKCTQSDRWRPTACSGKFFGEHRSVGPLVHPFCCDYQSSSLFDCLTLEYRWLTKLPTSAKAKTRHSDTRLPYWTGVQGSKCWHVVGRTVKKRLYQQRKGESLEKKDTHESPTAIG